MTRRRRRSPDHVDPPKRRRRGGNRPPGNGGRRRQRRHDDPADEPAAQRSASETDAEPSTEHDATPQPAADEPASEPAPTRSDTVATEVTLPQLGESVTEGTIINWLVSVGDEVDADQPLFELSSDKIDTEVPAPAAGVIKEIKVDVDETVEVGTVVAIIGDADEAADTGDGQAAATEETAEAEAEGEESAAEAEEADAEEADAEEADAEAEAEEAPSEAERERSAEAEREPAAEGEPSGDGHAQPPLASPLVRRIASEKGVDVSAISGSGEGGRVTREDVEAAAGEQAPAAEKAEPAAPAQVPPAPEAKAEPSAKARPAADGERERVEDLSRIRSRIADKMMESLQSSAQLTTVQEVDVTRIMSARGRVKDTFKQREGVSLSPFAFLCKAAVMAVRNHPRINAHADWQASKVTYRDYVNLGLAVDTEKGLIVPNIKGADDLSLAGMARAIKEMADKARGVKKLEMDDIQGGTFTMTNTGSVGVLIDTPILNYPEVAILGTGAIKKRPVVIEADGADTIAVRHMMYLSLTYDHRLIDGADAARFVTEVKDVVESTDWDAEIGY